MLLPLTCIIANQIVLEEERMALVDLGGDDSKAVEPIALFYDVLGYCEGLNTREDA